MVIGSHRSIAVRAAILTALLYLVCSVPGLAVELKAVGHAGAITSLVLNNDETILASADGNGDIILWKVGTQEPVANLCASAQSIRHLSFSHDGSKLLSLSKDGVITTWDVATRKMEQSQKPKDIVLNAEFDGESNSQVNVLSVPKDAGYKEPDSWSKKSPLLGIKRLSYFWHGNSLSVDVPLNTTVATASPGGMIACGCEDGYLSIFDPRSVRTHSIKAHAFPITAVQIDASAKLCLSRAQNGETKVWNIANDSPIFSKSCDASDEKLFVLNREGRCLYCGKGSFGLPDGKAKGKSKPYYYVPDPDGESITLDKEGQRLFVVSGTIKILRIAADEENAKEEAEFGKALSAVGHASYDRQKQQLAVSAADGVHIIDADNGDDLHHIPGSDKDLSFLPDSKLIVSGRYQDSYEIWDLDQGLKLSSIKITGYGSAYSPLPLVAHKNSNGRLEVWDCATGKMRDIISLESVYPDQIAITNDGTGIVLADDVDNNKATKLEFRRGDNGSVYRDLKIPNGESKVLCFDPMGKWLACGFKNGIISIVDRQTAAILGTLRTHSGPITALSFDTSSSRLASGSEDSTLCIWNTSTWSPTKQFKAHNGTVTDVLFDADSVITSGNDGAVRFWDTHSDQPTKTLYVIHDKD